MIRSWSSRPPWMRGRTLAPRVTTASRSVSRSSSCSPSILATPRSSSARPSLPRKRGTTSARRGHLDLLRRIDPGFSPAAVLRARLALEDGNLRLARRLTEQQIRLSPDDAALHEMRAAVAYLSGEYQEAAAALSVAERLGAPQWRLEFHRGLLEERAGRPDAAMGHYRAALSRTEHGPSRARLRALEAGGLQ